MYETIVKASKQIKKNTTSVRYKELDSLRGFAAIYVMLFHFSHTAGLHSTFLDAGVTGVDLFFIISGYVIFMSLEKTKRSGDFVISRLSRLFPSYLVMMAITIGTTLLFAPSRSPSLSTVLLNTTMLQQWFYVPYIDESYWTLTVELLFYVFMLFLFSIKKLDRIILIGGVTSVLLFVFYYLTWKYGINSKIYIVPRYLLPVTCHFQLFFAGIIFYKMKFIKNAWYSHVLLAVCYLITLFFFDKSGRAHFFISFPLYATAIFIYFLIFYLFVHNKLSFLNIPVLVFFGGISYGIYLLHQEFANIVYPYLISNLGLSQYGAIGMMAILIIVISAIVTYKIERPVIKLIRNRYIRFTSR